MTRLVSVDSSTNKSGVATFDDGKLVDYQLFDHSKNKDTEDRINQMGKSLLGYLAKQKPDIFYCEHPQGQGSNVSMVGKLCEILGIMRAYCITKNIEYNELAPSQWRSYLGWNQGRKKREELKQMSIDYIKEKYNLIVNDDVADAIALGASVIKHFNELEGKIYG